MFQNYESTITALEMKYLRKTVGKTRRGEVGNTTRRKKMILTMDFTISKFIHKIIIQALKLLQKNVECFT